MEPLSSQVQPSGETIESSRFQVQPSGEVRPPDSSRIQPSGAGAPLLALHVQPVGVLVQPAAAVPARTSAASAVTRNRRRSLVWARSIWDPLCLELPGPHPFAVVVLSVAQVF